MKNILNLASRFLTSHLYKWILPAIATYMMFFLGDSSQKFMLRLVLWLLLVIAFVSIPINFEHPKRKFFEAYINKKILYVSIVSIQIILLGIGVFAITFFAVIWCISPLREYAVAFSVINSMLYSGCLLLEFSLLPERLAKV
jgi:hypothetical protein